MEDRSPGGAPAGYPRIVVADLDEISLGPLVVNGQAFASDLAQVPRVKAFDDGRIIPVRGDVVEWSTARMQVHELVCEIDAVRREISS